MLYPMEQKLMSILWERSPITAAHLARIAADEIGWKRTTTYTVVARLTERGILQRQGKLVRPLLSREAFEDESIRALLTDVFGGDWSRLNAALQRQMQMSDLEKQANPIDILPNV